MKFGQIQWNKVFCGMHGLAVTEVMTLSGFFKYWWNLPSSLGQNCNKKSEISENNYEMEVA